MTNHKRVASSITRDVSDIELWDDEIEEKERLDKEKEQEKEESEDWDAPEAQTEPGNGLTWDEMIPKDHGVAPSWVERQEWQKLEMNLPWRCDPEGTFWQRDPSPRWRVREEWTRASFTQRASIMKYKLVMGPDSVSPGRNVHPLHDINGNDEMDAYATATATESEL